ncbi:enoyl-CoA hydratase [Tistrella bauzanensis]|uniref:Enoyl-CoA hydratase n=2 Tax=Tistrella bauzanensis TaxID=657419 RepID=A0ABQ1IJK6_9PROT|nr:enoyl-CoA hydratase [Tistrella bauzanensis]
MAQTTGAGLSLMPQKPPEVRPMPADPKQPAFRTLDYAVADGIATATFNRPEKMNTFNGAMMDDLLRLFDVTDADDDVRAVIVTGSGRAFCAGADLESGGDTFDFDKRVGIRDQVAGVHRDGGGQVTLRIFDSLKPVISAVNGAAVGVGATMQLAMDIRMASNNARFGFVFARRGITPEAASSWFLPRLVGMQTALEWVYTGRVFNADEALARGLVRSVHAPDDLLPAARALAREIADNAAPVSVAMARQMLWRLQAEDHPMAAHRIDSRAIVSRGRSSDVEEGIKAFLEKRPAQFANTVSADMPDVYPWWPEPKFL